MDTLRITILRCWRAETDCDLVALEKFRELLEVEKERAGVLPKVAPAKREEIGLTTLIPLDFDGRSQISD